MSGFMMPLFWVTLTATRTFTVRRDRVVEADDEKEAERLAWGGQGVWPGGEPLADLFRSRGFDYELDNDARVTETEVIEVDPQTPGLHLAGLTVEEMQALAAVAEHPGRTLEQVGASMGTTGQDLSRRLKYVPTKLGVPDRPAAVALFLGQQVLVPQAADVGLAGTPAYPLPSAHPPPPQNGGAACPECGGPTYDNRADNARRRMPRPDLGAPEGYALIPDFKCKNRGRCGGCIWPDDSFGRRHFPKPPGRTGDVNSLSRGRTPPKGPAAARPSRIQRVS